MFGAEPVHELIAGAPGAVRTLYVRADLQARFAGDIERVRAAGGHVVAAEAAALVRMAGAESRHQGVVALIREYSYAAFEDVVAAAPDPLLLVDGVTTHATWERSLRSAEGAGVSTVVLARDRTAAVTPAAIKSSSGAWVHLKIARCGNVARAMEELKQAGYWIAALAPEGDREIYELDTTRRLALVVGSEGRGRARDRQEELGFRGADSDVRKGWIAQRLGGGGGCVVRDRAPARGRASGGGRQARMI